MKLPHNIDFSYILSHSNGSNYKIPQYYDRETWTPGETYRMRISNIYDPSKFWIVLMEQELDIFQRYLLDFYTKYGSYYKMLLNVVARNMYCVAFTENAFYRGIIVNIPHSTTLEAKAIVFLFDFGYISAVNLKDLYYMSEKLFNTPQFAVRASLSNIKPYDTYMWDNNVVKRFSELVSQKVLLAILDCTDASRKIVEISVGSVNEDSTTITDIGDVLINEKFAKYLTTKKEVPEELISNSSRYVPKTKYPYLFPSFEAIESGMVPSTVHISEMLRDCVARDVLFKPYFTYKRSEDCSNSF